MLLQIRTACVDQRFLGIHPCIVAVADVQSDGHLWRICTAKDHLLPQQQPKTSFEPNQFVPYMIFCFSLKRKEKCKIVGRKYHLVSCEITSSLTPNLSNTNREFSSDSLRKSASVPVTDCLGWDAFCCCCTCECVYEKTEVRETKANL